MTGEGRPFDVDIEAAGRKVTVSALLMGVPHTVVLTEDVDAVEAELLGPAIEHHAIFPRRTNVNFVQIIDSANIRVRTWERGAGLTLACGTGACASVVAMNKKGLISKKATAHLAAGRLIIEYLDDGRVHDRPCARSVHGGTAGMNTQLPDSLVLLSDKFAAHGFSLFLVGGYVRNIVLRLPGGDFDVCSAAMPDDAAKIAQDAGFYVVKKAAELGTIEIHIASGTFRHVFEHTTFRRDYYPPGGAHRPYRVRFTQNIEEDARRRDFTAGALYLNIRTGMITDPTKRAFDDINKGVLRAADDDPDITIRDDGLRIMRMARLP